MFHPVCFLCWVFPIIDRTNPAKERTNSAEAKLVFVSNVEEPIFGYLTYTV